MGNKASECSTSNDDATAETFGKLINLGYDEHLSLMAATKYKNNINKAIDFIQQNIQKSTDNNHNKDPCITCKRIEDCLSVQRVINMLEWYQIYKTTDYDNDDQEISEFFHLIHTKYNHIMNDFHHILNVYLNEDKVSSNKSDDNFEYIYNEIMKRDNMKCDINCCSIFIRNEREREKEIKRNKREKEMVSVYFLDCIHCYFCHSVDIGYRLQNKQILLKMDQQQNNQNNKICYDEYLFLLQNNLKQKRQKLQEIRGIIRYQNNKFNTIIQNKDKKEEEREQKKSNEEKQQHQEHTNDTFYSFGNRYKYSWDIDGDDDVDDDDDDDDDDKPKYNDLKEEILNNSIYHIDGCQYDEAYNKAIYLLNNSNQIKRIRSKIDKGFGNTIHDIESRKLMGLHNILSLIFYTDYDLLSFHFSSTFRNLSETETYQQAQQRNGEFWHWSKTLIETVNCWGTRMKNTNIKSFYHGVSNMYFNKFITSFNSPTSTTTKLQVAAIFAKQTGIILELNQGNKASSSYLRYFNCSFISNYANEDERLFIQPPSYYHQLRIRNIRNLSTNEQYKNYINAITTLDHIFNETTNYRKQSMDISPDVVVNINNIIEMVATDDQSDIVPKYIQICILKWINIKEYKLAFNMKQVMNIGKGLNIWDEKNPKVLKLQIILKLKRTVIQIDCLHAGDIDAEYLCSLISIFKAINNIKYSKLRCISLDGINIKYSESEFNEYQTLFQKEGWKMQRNIHGFKRLQFTSL